MNWFRQYVFGSHEGEWLALAMVIFLLFVLRIVALRFWLWLITHIRSTHEGEDESEKEYWRIHGG